MYWLIACLLILGDTDMHKQFVAALIRRNSTGAILLAALAWGGIVRAQDTTSAQQQTPAQQPTPAPTPQQEQAQVNPAARCLQPAPIVSWKDYQGKFAKVVGAFGRKLERRSVHPMHYKAGEVMCTLEVKDKFILFVEDMIEPITFLDAGFNAGIGQAENSDRSYGQGAAGYGKRFGASLTDQASAEFFKDFAYPTVFAEDPRYYRLAQGSTGSRLWHAVAHSVVAHRTNGALTFNYSEWLGTTSAVLLANTYHVDNRRGVGSVAERVGIGVGSDIGFDMLREFWPEIAHKLKLPFRGQAQSPN